MFDRVWEFSLGFRHSHSDNEGFFPSYLVLPSKDEPALQGTSKQQLTT